VANLVATGQNEDVLLALFAKGQVFTRFRQNPPPAKTAFGWIVIC
jgi:hypothetical protein